MVVSLYRCELYTHSLTGPFGGQPVGGFFSLSSGPMHVHEAEHSLDFIYLNFRENKKLLLEKSGGVYFTE